MGQGRKPIGDRAMTDAERQRRRRDRLRAAQSATTTATTDTAEVSRLKARIAELEAEVARLRGRPAEPEKHTAQTQSAPKQQTIDNWVDNWEEEMRERTRANAEAYDRERAQYGNRTKARVLFEIDRMLSGRGLSDGAKETIAHAMLPHVAGQNNIERGISRRTYSKVLADLHTDRNAADAEAFIAFKALDAKVGGKHPNSIVIADDKVTTVADHWRKREERSAKARAAAAARRGL